MALFSFLKSKAEVPAGDDPEIDRVLRELVRESGEANVNVWSVKIPEFPVYQHTIHSWPDATKLACIHLLIRRISKYLQGRFRDEPYTQAAFNANAIYEALLLWLLKPSLVLSGAQMASLYEAFATYPRYDVINPTEWPIIPFLNIVEKNTRGQETDPSVRSALLQLRATLASRNNYLSQREDQKLIGRINQILGENEGTADPAFPASDDLADYAHTRFAKMTAEERSAWVQLIDLAKRASGSKPTRKYLDEARKLLALPGVSAFCEVMGEWIAFLVSLPDKPMQYRFVEFPVAPVNGDVLKGLVWMCVHYPDDPTARMIGSLAARCYRTIPGKGPAAPGIGNACAYVLQASGTLAGISQLSRLRLRVKQNNVQALIDRYLHTAAKEQGVSIHEIEDMAADDFGLKDGTRTWDFDGYLAELRMVTAGKTEITWTKPNGDPQKSAPAFVQEKYADEWKQVKETAKQVAQSLSVQRDRIDRMFRADRRMNLSYLQATYLDHGLLGYLGRQLIWVFRHAEEVQSAFYMDGMWIDRFNQPVVPHPEAQASLWHPAFSTVSEIREWRSFILANTIRQPLKQAFREVYYLTDAELNTRTYSNRMAAHLLKQHQFNSLAKLRGWNYSLMGAYDDGRSFVSASLKLPDDGLLAEYWINEVNMENGWTESGIWQYVSTDQVRFLNEANGEVVDLIDIPPLAFSEVMRDADLFVGVASVGNDPEWQDMGGIPDRRDYWHSYSFGDLSETAKIRAELLASLLPRLKIARVAELRDRFLVIQGKLRTYKIHLGSTNILMEPNDQYLCIVPARNAASTANIFLPFEGDTGLSVILSKAFMLADDDKISDPTITSQISRQ